MYQQPPAGPPRRGWATWNSRQRIAAVGGGLCAVSALCYAAATGVGHQPDSTSPAAAISSPAFTVPTASSGTTTAPAAGQTTVAAAAGPAKPIDQAGDPGTPCAMTYRAEGQQTRVVFAFADAGEIITHLSDTAGNIYRHDDQVSAGARAYIDDVPLSQVDDAGAIFQDADGTRHVCSIAAG